MQFREMIFSNFPSYNFENKFFLYDFEGSKSQISWQSEELVLYDLTVLFSILLTFRNFCLYHFVSICKKTIVLRMVHLGQVDLKKRVQLYPMSSVWQAAAKNRGQSFLWDSECAWEDWRTWDAPEPLAVSGS